MALPSRDMWVWNETVATNPAQQKQFFDYAAVNNINGVYFHCPGLVQTNPAALRNFVLAAKSHAISVDFLFGDPSWALTANHSAAINLAKAVVKFAKTYPDAAPRSIHYDVEPYLLPQWQSSKTNTANQYIDLIDKLKAITGPAALQLTLDIPFWFDGENIARSGGARPLNQWVQDRADKVVLMDYRDTADLIIQYAADEIAYGDKIGKQVAIGVETAPGQTPSYVSFYEEGTAAMETALRIVQNYYSSHRSYGGIAIHGWSPTASASSLTPPQIAALPTTTVRAWTVTEIQALNTTQISAITASQIAVLSTTQIQGLAPSQVGALTTKQMRALTGAQLAAMRNTQIAGLTSTNLSVLSPTLFAALSSTQLSALNTAQIKGLTASEIEALSSTQIGGFTPTEFAALTTTQIRGFSASDFASLTTTQLAAVSPTLLASLTVTQLGGFTMTELAALTATQFGGVTATEIRALSALQFGVLSTTVIAALTRTQLQALTTTEIAAFRGAQISALSTVELATLSTTQARAFTTTQLATMTTAQYNALALRGQ
jgi:hypothetical protein